MLLNTEQGRVVSLTTIQLVSGSTFEVMPITTTLVEWEVLMIRESLIVSNPSVPTTAEKRSSNNVKSEKRSSNNAKSDGFDSGSEHRHVVAVSDCMWFYFIGSLRHVSSSSTHHGNSRVLNRETHGEDYSGFGHVAGGLGRR